MRAFSVSERVVGERGGPQLRRWFGIGSELTGRRARVLGLKERPRLVARAAHDRLQQLDVARPELEQLGGRPRPRRRLLPTPRPRTSTKPLVSKLQALGHHATLQPAAL